MTIKGLITALVTPFTADGDFDEEGFRQNIQDQIAAGVDGLLALGTTGEGPTLTPGERRKIFEILVEEASGKVMTLAGTGSNSTRATVELTREAEAIGVDVALIVSPYYNCPQQEGIYRHYAEIHDATNLPIVLYSIGKRTGRNILADTILRLEKLERIVGVKECSGDLDITQEVMEKRAKISVFCGDDPNAFTYLALGAEGHISVASNLIPDEMVTLVTLLEKGDYTSARELHFTLLPLLKSLFVEVNPVPVKEAMNQIGRAAGPCRLPLAPMDEKNRKVLMDKVNALIHCRSSI